MDRRTLCYVALGFVAFAALTAGITCLALEMPTAGVPLIIVAGVAPIGLLERQCHPSPQHKSPLSAIEVTVHTGAPKEDNPRPE
jgi:hypothetical protein